MIKTESTRKGVDLIQLAVAVLSVVFVASAFAQDDPVVEELLLDEELELLLEDPQMPGTIEGTGTYFEVTDSEYLNIVFQSSELVHLTLESVPKMVVMHIEAAEGASSTWITLTGFAPSTTYYKYEDDYHNGVAFTTDDSGSYTFAQDLAISQLVFIQPQAGTIYLSDTGWSDPTVGTWEASTKTGTLMVDLDETIQIDSDEITLDGNGHTLTGGGDGYGVYLSYRTGVTIKNLNVQDFTLGIYLYYSNGNTVNGNVLTNNNYGIRLSRSMYNSLTGNIASNNFYGIIGGGSNNTLTGNTANSNSNTGINLNWSGNNSLTGNTANSNGDYGIYVSWSGNDSLTGNTANSNSTYGIYVYQCRYNTTLTGNTANSNKYIGIYFQNSSNNTLTGNTANSNGYYGIDLYNAFYNTLAENTANSNNYYGIVLGNSSGNSLTGNIINLNACDGLVLGGSGYCTLTGNTVSQNYRYGLRLGGSSWDNHIYNNNFIDNPTQAYVTGNCVGNVFNLEKPIGGNYWSDWTVPDEDGDGFVDEPYVIDDDPSHLVQDNLPWVREDGWALTPQEAIEQLIDQVAALNLQKGIDNSLDAKLDAAFKALDDVNANNDVAAINALQAFINAVEAQRGDKISDADADALIAAVQDIIAMLSSS
ncbi:MAG: right-handed parallel beta-helix repeat-containing protein [Phycisphaerales bacterium]|nr:MAG: right-handed parallel beta-helix repeat-containing protein [Phycisphaerales bacterium]